MRFSPQQDCALCAAASWLRAPDAPVFRLFGYAGTGKTTLAKHLAEHVDGRVRFAAYTGKAAHVMRMKGCKDAGTLHGLIYICSETEDGPQFELTDQSPLAEAKLLIVDECSMVDATLGKDILSFEVPVLVLGDPEQLPPVHGAGFFTNAAPDVLLTDIQRQARDNPIIHMATTVREGGRLAVGNYGDSYIVNANDVSVAELAVADQVLVGRNRTRRDINAQLRDHLGLYGAVPQPSDRLVCLRNNHRRGLLNGSTWRTRTALANGNDTVMLGITPDDDSEAAVIYTTTHLAFFRETAERELKYFQRREFDPFNFAYGLTVHKAQGSQWSNVTIFNEAGVFGEHARRWLYTAITCAADRLTLVQGAEYEDEDD
jgi:exodeoxyribonuclease-5